MTLSLPVECVKADGIHLGWWNFTTMKKLPLAQQS